MGSIFRHLNKVVSLDFDQNGSFWVGPDKTGQKRVKKGVFWGSRKPKKRVFAWFSCVLHTSKTGQKRPFWPILVILGRSVQIWRSSQKSSAVTTLILAFFSVFAVFDVLAVFVVFYVFFVSEKT